LGSEYAANRTDRCRIGVAVLLKYFQLNGRFPRQHRDIPGAVLAFLGEQLSVAPESWFDYDLWGRSGQRDRERIRAYLGYLRPTPRNGQDCALRALYHFDISTVSKIANRLGLSASMHVGCAVSN
jgi:hypothetical protein